MDGTILGKKYNLMHEGGGGGGEASDVSYDNSESHLEADTVQEAIDEVIVNFQAGVDDVYDACVAKGSTPASHSLSDVITAIGNIETGGGLTQINPFGSSGTISLYNANGVTVSSSSVDSDGTGSMVCSESQAGYEGFVLELDGVTAGKKYLLTFDLQFTAETQFMSGYRIGFTLENSAFTAYNTQDHWTNNIARDAVKNPYIAAIIASGTKLYVNFNVCGLSDSVTNGFTMSDIKLFEIAA